MHLLSGRYHRLCWSRGVKVVEVTVCLIAPGLGIGAIYAPRSLNKRRFLEGARTLLGAPGIATRSKDVIRGS